MRKIFVLIVISSFSIGSFGQDPRRFIKEVEEITTNNNTYPKKNLNLFTGSSSIRMWTDVKDRFPNHNVVNTGFGGSQMSELFYFEPELIGKYKPSRIFVYEGDNDLAAGESKEEILSDADKLLKMVRKDVGNKVKVFFITPKPSIARWHLKDKYIDFISGLKLWAATKPNVAVIDVWTPMLTSDGQLMRDLYIEDGLHMNSKGYDIWQKTIQPFLLKK